MMSEETRNEFIRINQVVLDRHKPANAIAICGPKMILDKMLKHPMRYTCEENNTFATEIENNQEEALQILASLGGLC